MDEDIFHGFTTIARNDPERRKFINRLLHQAREEEHEDELCDASYKEVLYIPNGSVIDLK